MKLSGTIKLKGDKSISHRALMLASIIKNQSKIRNISLCEDVESTMESLKLCNIKIKECKNELIINGGTLSAPSTPLDMQNSGTSARLLLGLLSGQNISANFIGDPSLSKRPMDRIINPLKKMGSEIESVNNYLPIKLVRGVRKKISFNENKKSAQIKSALMFASMGIENESEIFYNKSTRDHTEKLLKYIRRNSFIKNEEKILIKKSLINRGFDMKVPGDMSNAAFIIAGAVLMKDSDVTIKNVLYNKTRNGFIELLIQMGADIKINNINEVAGGESICDISVKYSGKLEAPSIKLDNIIPLIDEIPILAVLATQFKGEIVIRNAEELRFKESDRIKAIYENLLQMGADIILTNKGFRIAGNKTLYNTSINHYGDHRIAMSFDIFNLFRNKKFVNYSKNLSKISFPEFQQTLNKLIK